MKIRKAFKFKLMPNGEQTHKMKQFCGMSRFVFNKALDWQNTQYKTDENFKFSYVKVANQLHEWKTEFSWLKLCHSQILQQSLKDLESAFRNFFKKNSDFPKFKKKGQKDSFRFPQGFKLEENNNRIYLPKIGWIKYRNSRKVSGTLKNVTISLKCNKWFAAIQIEEDITASLTNNTEVGIDMGITRFATLSNGEYFEPKNSFKLLSNKLKKAQQQLSHKEKFSKNWVKAKNKVSKIHNCIANVREDYLHKVSTTISKNHAIIYVEDLKVSNMSKSAKGNAEKSGNMVKQKSGLNKSILDQGWFEFRRQLDYKTMWHGGSVIAVPPKNTSITCPHCNNINKANRQTQALFVCTTCGFTENADVVGAINVLRAGHARFACEVNDVVISSAAGTRRSELVEYH